MKKIYYYYLLILPLLACVLQKLGESNWWEGL